LFDEWDHARNQTNKKAVAFVRVQMNIEESEVGDRQLIRDMIRPARREYEYGGDRRS
jgi:hypothetical protein